MTPDGQDEGLSDQVVPTTTSGGAETSLPYADNKGPIALCYCSAPDKQDERHVWQQGKESVRVGRRRRMF